MLKVWIVHFLLVMLFTILVITDVGGSRNECEMLGTCECGKQLKVWYYSYMAATSLNFFFECYLYHLLN